MCCTDVLLLLSYEFYYELCLIYCVDLKYNMTPPPLHVHFHRYCGSRVLEWSAHKLKR